MPFTPTHIAAAIPIAWLCRWRVPFTALAIGCMTCDLAVFFPGLFDYNLTHSLQGIFTLCLPLGALLYYGYHWFIKEPMSAILPEETRRLLVRGLRWQPPTTFAHILLVCLLIVVGASTHVFWDSFTHAGRWGVKALPWLKEPMLSGAVANVPWYSFFQHASSVFLLPPMLMGWIVWMRRQPPGAEHEIPRVHVSVQWIAVFLVLVVPTLVLIFDIQKMVDVPLSRVIHVSVKRSGAILICLCTFYVFAYAFLTRRRALDRIFGADGSAPTEGGTGAR